MKVTVRGIPIHYLAEGEGHPVLMLHGRPADHRLTHHHLEPIFAVQSATLLPNGTVLVAASRTTIYANSLSQLLATAELYGPGPGP